MLYVFCNNLQHSYLQIADKPTWLNVAWDISDLLWMTNYGINFVFYCASGHNFRRTLIRMFTRRQDTRTNNKKSGNEE